MGRTANRTFHRSEVRGISRAFRSPAHAGSCRINRGSAAEGIEGLEVGGELASSISAGEPKDRVFRFHATTRSNLQEELRPEPPLPGTTETIRVRENQLASLFARWVLPGAGFEIYGEFGREDHSANLRDFLSEPDHGGSSRMLGLRKMWRNGYALRTRDYQLRSTSRPEIPAGGSVYLQAHTSAGPHPRRPNAWRGCRCKGAARDQLLRWIGTDGTAERLCFGPGP